MLSDPIPIYTSRAYLADLAKKLPLALRSNRILFNPHKGAKITRHLRDAFPNVDFMPLAGYDREQLAEIFLTSKLYIDFGHHPGKDRLPREAAIHGCCVMTGVNGSAANEIDVPIDARYKLDEKNVDFIATFAQRVQRIFDNFDESARDFEHYRATIANEQFEFDRQIIAAFNLGKD
jgi:hypothetical protein